MTTRRRRLIERQAERRGQAREGEQLLMATFGVPRIIATINADARLAEDATRALALLFAGTPARPQEQEGAIRATLRRRKEGAPLALAVHDETAPKPRRRALRERLLARIYGPPLHPVDKEG